MRCPTTSPLFSNKCFNKEVKGGTWGTPPPIFCSCMELSLFFFIQRKLTSASAQTGNDSDRTSEESPRKSARKHDLLGRLHPVSRRFRTRGSAPIHDRINHGRIDDVSEGSSSDSSIRSSAESASSEKGSNSEIDSRIAVDWWGQRSLRRFSKRRSPKRR
jgi:hypothetical protein